MHVLYKLHTFISKHIAKNPLKYQIKYFSVRRAGILQVIFVRGSDGGKAIKLRFYIDWKVLSTSNAY